MKRRTFSQARPKRPFSEVVDGDRGSEVGYGSKVDALRETVRVGRCQVVISEYLVESAAYRLARQGSVRGARLSRLLSTL